jgi:DNA-directed RNA polymerase specialized sigma24 family protein
MLFKYSIKVRRDKDLTKDCIQDIFTELWGHREKVKPVHHIKAYLLKYFRRHLLDKVLLERKNTENGGRSAFGAGDSFESILLKRLKQQLEDTIRQDIINLKKIDYGQQQRSSLHQTRCSGSTKHRLPEIIFRAPEM